MSWFWVRYSIRGVLLSADLRLLEELIVIVSCFKIDAVWWQISSACCVATCLWMLVWSVKSCWQHFHHFSLHSKEGARTSLVLTKRANACNYTPMSLLNNLRFKANGSLSKIPSIIFPRGFQFYVLLFCRTSCESNSFHNNLYTSWTRSGVLGSSCPSVCFPYD